MQNYFRVIDAAGHLLKFIAMITIPSFAHVQTVDLNSFTFFDCKRSGQLRRFFFMVRYRFDSNVIFSHFHPLFTAPRLTFMPVNAIIFDDLWVEKAYASAAHNRKLRRMAN